MVFHSKVDRFFVAIISIMLLGILAMFMIPLILDNSSTVVDAVIVLSICVLSIGSILWCTFFIKYTFSPNHLFVKGGLFRSRIPYGNITSVSPTNAIFTGYRVLSSKDGIEIFYTNATLGSVKISPKNKEAFLAELAKRCPNVEIQIQS